MEKRKHLLRVSLFLTVLILVLAALALLWPHLPYQSAAAARITAALQAQGLEVTSLRVETLNEQEAVLSQISIGKEHAFTIGRAVVRYRLSGLADKKIDALSLEGVTVHIYQTAGRWQIGGLEARMDAPASGEPFPAFDAETLKALLPEHITLTGGMLNVDMTGATLTLPFTLEFTAKDAPVLAIASPSLRLDAKPYGLTSGPISFAAQLEEKGWQGTLKAQALAASGLPQPVPPLTLASRFSANASALTAQGTLADAAKAWVGGFSLNAPLDAPGKGAVNLRGLSFPWAGGTVAVESARIPLSGGEIALPVQVSHVGLAELFTMIGEGKISGTGSISGLFPLRILPGNIIRLEDGEASAEGEGVIALSGDALPAGGNDQLDMVKRALQNFHYSALKIHVSSDAENNPSAKMTVEGFSPDAWDGKRVKLTVNLTGDLLPLLKQSLLPLSDPKQLLNAKETK